MWFAEDLWVGREFDLGTISLGADEIIEFARRWDPLPMHTDLDAAADGPLGGLCASGSQVLAVYVRLASDAIVSRTATLGGRGVRDLRFHRPVRPGMPLTGRTIISGHEPARPGATLVLLAGELRGDQDDRVLSLTGEILMAQRQAGEVSARTPTGAR
jgi:acyl dehydratase